MGPSVDDLTTWWNSWWVKTALYAALAAFGGFMGHIMRSLDKPTPVSYRRAAVEGMAAGFVGLLVMLMCSAMNLSEQWTGVIVGVSGWLGANASIRILEKRIFKQLGLSTGDTNIAPLVVMRGEEGDDRS